MIIGVTGTRAGMTEEQFDKFYTYLYNYRPLAIHHGDCVGVDSEVHEICLQEEIPIIVHPPIEGNWRAFSEPFYQIKKEKPYLERNKAIVAECNMLIAFPKQHMERIRSGTWTTVRYARTANKHIVIIWPNGTVTEENYEQAA